MRVLPLLTTAALSTELSPDEGLAYQKTRFRQHKSNNKIPYLLLIHLQVCHAKGSVRFWKVRNAEQAWKIPDSKQTFCLSG